MVVSNSIQNLSLDVQGSSIEAKPGSDPVERVITLQNRGEKTAQIELWIEPVDAHAASLLQWSLFDKSDTDLVLPPNGKIDVTLSFLIPLQAEPGFYNYEIRLRSLQYQNEDIRRPQQLQVLPSAQEVRLRNEPKISLAPVTNSDHPHQLRAGETFTLTITIENPSRRTDRFLLHCPDLDADWYSVIYPEDRSNPSGKLSYTDGLELNPGDQGEIRLQIHPPQNTPAGQYFPTVRLTSKVRPELVLLRVVYFTLVVNAYLDAELSPTVQSMPNPNPGFRLCLTNAGNIQRHLILQAWDVERLLAYHFHPSEMVLMPGQEDCADITVHPRRWWHRIWRLRDREVTFEVLIENQWPQAPELDPDLVLEPALPEPLPTGKVLYKSQRRWLFRLLLLTAGIGAAVTLLWLIWEFLIWRPSLKPTVVEISPTQEAFDEGNEPITLSWEITNPAHISHLVLTSKSNQLQGFEDIRYELNDPEVEGSFPLGTVVLPPGLQDANCRISDRNESSLFSPLLRAYRGRKGKTIESQSLRCSAVELITPNAALSPPVLTEGQYDFELEVFWNRQGQNHQGQDQSDSTASVTRRNWFRLPQRFFPFQKTDSTPAQDTAAQNQEARFADRATVSDVVIAPPALPRISDFRAAAAAYQPADSDPTDGDLAVAPILLNWTIDNPSEIQAIQIVSLAPDGSANTEPLPFVFSNGQPPDRLAQYCTGSTALQLRCENVVTNATEVGEYTFYLRVISARNDASEAIAQQAPMVAIQPLEPVIVTFQVNGIDVLEQPRRVFTLNPEMETWDILLSWETENVSRIELAPAPGEIQDNSITYTLSAAPGVEKIELTAFNEAGQAVKRSVVIEKTTPYMPENASPLGLPGQLPFVPPPPSPALGPHLPASPLPSSVEGLEPVQTPPQAD